MSVVEGVRGPTPAPPMPVFPMSGRHVENGYRIVAVDGAGEDGSTLYVLYNRVGRMITAAAWPQPLELIAANRLDLITWQP